MTRLAKLSMIFLLVSALWISQANAEMVDYRTLYRQTAPTVVFIAALTQGNYGSSGTGSIITKEGHVLTNHHVIWDDKGNRVCPRIFVFLKPPKVTGENANDLSRQYRAKVLHYDAKLDLAVLQIQNPPDNLPILAMQNSDLVETGAPTIAIGHPEQGVRWTLTTGALSGQIRNFSRVSGKHVFQMETSVNRGNSGGPLIDHKGNMIGINSMIARVGAGGVAITDINFAIQTNVARQWLESKGVRPTSRPIAYNDGGYQNVQYNPATRQIAEPQPQPEQPAQQQQQIADGGNREQQRDDDEGRREVVVNQEEPSEGVMIRNEGEVETGRSRGFGFVTDSEAGRSRGSEVGHSRGSERQNQRRLVSIQSGQEYTSDEDEKLVDHLSQIRAKMRAFERGDAKSMEEDAQEAIRRLRNRRNR